MNCSEIWTQLSMWFWDENHMILAILGQPTCWWHPLVVKTWTWSWFWYCTIGQDKDPSDRKVQRTDCSRYIYRGACGLYSKAGKSGHFPYIWPCLRSESIRKVIKRIDLRQKLEKWHLCIYNMYAFITNAKQYFVQIYWHNFLRRKQNTKIIFGYVVYQSPFYNILWFGTGATCQDWVIP